MTVRLSLQALSVLKHLLRGEDYGLSLVGKAGCGLGTVYGILDRLAREGWVTPEAEDGHAVNLGRKPRVYYRLTERGRAETLKTLSSLKE